MADNGVLFRYAKYLCINGKDLHIHVEEVLVAVTIRDNMVFVPLKNGTYLVIDHQNRKLFKASNDLKIEKQEANFDTMLLHNLTEEIRKYFYVFESVLSNAMFAVYGTHADHEEGLV